MEARVAVPENPKSLNSPETSPVAESIVRSRALNCT